MKRKLVPRALVLALLLALVTGVLLTGTVFPQIGDGFDLTWHVMAGGGAGGPLSGDGFEMRSTASQTAIGPAIGGPFDLGQGYWYGITAVAACTEVTGVDLTIINPGPIYIGDVVTFSADIIPDDADKPYNYRTTVDGTPGPASSSSDDPLVFTDSFVTTGTHTVTLAVWNCLMQEMDAVTDTVAFTAEEPPVCVDLTSITIAGPSTGPPGTYTFTTSYQPPNATPPISYLWDNGDSTAISVRSLGVGTHILEVTATNCLAALVTDTHTIVITIVVPDHFVYLPVIYKNTGP